MQQSIFVDVLLAVAIFLIGSAAGAVVTAAFYSSQMRSMKSALRQVSLPSQSPMTNPDDTERKSA